MNLHRIKILVGIVCLALLTLSFLELKESTSNQVEKVYVHTDRTFYFPGETIWFKAYITNSENKATQLSDIAYAQLISPKGETVSNMLLSVVNGYAYGDFIINSNWAGGQYKLKLFTRWMKNYEEEAIFAKDITVQKIVKPNLLMTLDFEKKSYGKSARVQANFKVEDLKNTPLNQNINYEVSIKGKQLLSKKMITDKNGKAQIVFNLPSNLSTRDVTLNVLVSHKGSMESISRTVPVTLDTINLQFMPESGKALVGIENTIAFKAVDEFGKPADISGDIQDEKGNVVSTFSSFHDGMGIFNFKPRANTTYFAKVLLPFESDSLFSLPEIEKKGTHFSVNQKDDTCYEVRIQSSKPIKDRFLQVSNATRVVSSEPIKAFRKSTTIDLETSTFVQGIHKLSVVDKSGNVYAERLLFVNKNAGLNIEIITAKEDYITREKVKLKIKTTDKNDEPVSANLSLSVVDNRLLTMADDKQDNIQSYLLVSAELKGKIHEPSFYFNTEKPKAAKALDLVMLTHGWRNHIVNPEITFENAEYKPEQRFLQTGRVVDRKGNPTIAKLILFNQDSDKALVFKTNKNGTFAFKMSTGRYSQLLAYRDDGKTVKIEAEDKNDSWSRRKNRNDEPFDAKTSLFKGNVNPIKKPIKKEAKAVAPAISLSEDAASLDEVVIVSYGTAQRKQQLGYAVSEISNGNIVPINDQDIGQLLQGKAAGVQIVSNSANPAASTTISLRGVNSFKGNNKPLFVIDGVPRSNLNTSVSELPQINPDNVEAIHVLKGVAATSIYGTHGSNGVILISTKNNQNTRNAKKLNNAKYNNYAVRQFYSYNRRETNTPTQFYMPVYEGNDLPEKRTDFRQTIYWNPVIQTDEKGEAELEYYNSDAITSFKIISEGIGYNGLVGRKEKAYGTKKLLNISLKTPNYMALNDRIILPITISNESEKTVAGTLDLDLPAELKLVKDFDTKLNIEAGSYQKINIEVMPIIRAEKVSITIKANTNDLTDVIKNDVTIISPYFPIEASVSGLKDGNYMLEVNNVVKNSSNASLTIYTDVIGDVMNGIESMIRQPYGCFEQVSSSTYPNILVLKYLQESGKSNKDIEQKALKFIKKGYKKLAAYETKEHGFEWYGDTPPHEALSAYGLMEFTEMKEVYNGVNEQMLQRTIDWLMSRKDGRGGFKQKSGKYGFSGAPRKVNNAYIVYAIAEAGSKVDIEKEFETAYKEALKSRDTYRLALVTNAAFTLNKKEIYNELIGILQKQLEEYDYAKLPVEASITRSYGRAKEIETISWVLLAMMKNGELNTAIINGVEYLISQRKHGRFGNTQSTSMALKVLIEYTKLEKKKIISQGDSVTISLNGNSFSAKLNSAKNGKLVIDSLGSYIKEGAQNIKVNFSNPEVIFPYSFEILWDSTVPDSSKESNVGIATTITSNSSSVGDVVRFEATIKNRKNEPLPMTTAIVGIPSGTSAQAYQLKQLLEENKVAYYEVFDNYLVFYWRELGPSETKTISLDLKAEVAGTYTAPASTVYLYYADEFKHWIKGEELNIK